MTANPEQGAPLTRSTYASVYRAFCAFVGHNARVDAFTSDRVRSYRDELERAGRSPATIAKHLSALRTLAAALGTDGVRVKAQCLGPWPRPQTTRRSAVTV